MQAVEQIFDARILHGPLYDESHRALAAQMREWLLALPRAPEDAAPPESRVRRYVSLLGREGWLRHLAEAGPRGRPSARAQGLIRQALAYFDDLADFAFSIQGLGLSPIAFYGSDALKRRFVQPSLAGELLGAFALTGPEGGSDGSGVSLTARRDGDAYVLDGRKLWIANAGLADYYCVFAATNPALGKLGVTCFVVPAGSEGLHVEPGRLMSPRPFGCLQFDGCVVPRDLVVGKEGFGLRYALEVIDLYRVSLAYAAVGSSACAVALASSRTKSRHIGGKTLAEYDVTRAKLADMVTELCASTLLASHAAWLHDSGGPAIAREAAMAKLFATESAQRIVDQALQLHGAEGLLLGSRTEELYRSVRATRIYEGTSEIQRMIIADSVR